MKKNMIIVSLLLMAGSAQAQWTMDDCISYAVSHALSVQKATAEVTNAQTDVGIALSDFLPSVSASTSGQYSWGRNVDPETNTYNTITTFGNSYSLYASLQVFDGGQTVNCFRQARLLRRQSQTQLQQAQDDKAIEVMQKFVDVVYAQQCLALAEEKLSDSRQLLQKTRRMEELGIKSQPDVAQIESQVAEDDYSLTHQQNQLQAAMLVLKSAMNYPVADSIAISFSRDARNTSQARKASLSGPASDASLFLPRAIAAEQSVRKAKLDYQISKGRLLPSLSFSAGVSTSYFRNISGGGTASPFHTQFWDNMGEYVYASLSLPIFDLSRYKNVRKAKNNILLSQLERDETMRKLNDEVQQAVMDCEGYRMEVEKMARKVQSDSLAWHLSSRKYEEGMLSTFDLHTASQTLLDARIRLLQTQMLYLIKQKLVSYYQTGSLIKRKKLE
ncbi:MAG: TolC family protein [Prevotella sp.]|nr:TolC family protein [Prevotella sp.]